MGSVQILLVEDDPGMQLTLARALTSRGMEVRICSQGNDVLALWEKYPADLVLLDLSLPSMDGLHILTQARQKGLRTPVLILTARGTVGDRVLGLQLGADDYLPKPFDLDELEARMLALMRRTPWVTKAESSGLWRDPTTGLVHLNGMALELPPREHALLSLLMEKTGTAVPRERAMLHVFPSNSQVHLEALDVVAYRLRKKLQGLPWQLVTLRGLGYVLKPQGKNE